MGGVAAHPADGYNLDGEGVLVVVGGAVLVVGDQLFIAAVLGRHHALHEADELERVRPIVEEEVHALQQPQKISQSLTSISQRHCCNWSAFQHIYGYSIMNAPTQYKEQ